MRQKEAPWHTQLKAMELLLFYCSSDSENKSLAGVTGVMPLSTSCRIREENFFFEVMPNSVSISA